MTDSPDPHTPGRQLEALDDGPDADVDATVRAFARTRPSASADPVFREAVREHLRHAVTDAALPHVSAGRASAQRRRWSRRHTFTLSAVLAAGLAGGGAALASGILPLPGADQVVLRAPAATAVHTGTATIDLGPRPQGVTSVELTLTCLSAGAFFFDDGAGLTCTPDDVATTSAATTSGTPRQRGSAGYTLPLDNGQTSTTITAAAGTRWSLTSAYSTRTPTDWGVNANGDTYGVSKDDGSTPDLVAVATPTSTGEQGYVRDADLNPQPAFTSPQQALDWQASHPNPITIPVYASDGVTVIGGFQVG